MERHSVQREAGRHPFGPKGPLAIAWFKAPHRWGKVGLKTVIPIAQLTQTRGWRRVCHMVRALSSYLHLPFTKLGVLRTFPQASDTPAERTPQTRVHCWLTPNLCRWTSEFEYLIFELIKESLSTFKLKTKIFNSSIHESKTVRK